MLKLKLFIIGIFLASPLLAGSAEFDKKMFDSIIETVRENARYDLSDNEIYRGAVQGVMQVLEEKNKGVSDRETARLIFGGNDRNTLLNPAQAENLGINTRGSFAGIGVAIEYKSGDGMPNPIIKKVMEGGGKKAGVRKDDQILKINGRPVAEFGTLFAIINEIRGPVDTRVALTLLRKSEVIDVKVTRETVKIEAVESRILPGGIGYIKLKNFSETAARDFDRELKNFQREKADRIILDLRNNFGGILQTGTEIMGCFTKKNDILFQEQKKTGTELKPFRAVANGAAADTDVVVLVNNGTRSVAEAMASMFKHRENSKVIGMATFGKASVEDVFNLSGNYRMVITVGMLYDSDGNTWHGTGVNPDIVVPESEDETDNLLDMAIDYVKRI
jgi:carboxyl-terminal processing protease